MEYRFDEYGKPIDEFPIYEVTNHGRVFNSHTGREMVLSPTQNGDLTVGLVRIGYQHRFSVKGLVARAFVPGGDIIYNTPTLLDGDKSNLHFSNIVWRPRWFAWKYSRQFTHPEEWYYIGPVQDNNGRVYENYITASMENGVLCEDIRESVYTTNHEEVFPTHLRFTYPNLNNI